MIDQPLFVVVSSPEPVMVGMVATLRSRGAIRSYHSSPNDAAYAAQKLKAKVFEHLGQSASYREEYIAQQLAYRDSIKVVACHLTEVSDLN